MVLIVIREDESQSLHREVIAAAFVAEQLTPAACLFDARPDPACNGGTGPGIHDNAIALTKSRGESGIPIASHRHARLRPGALD